ncbi:hypothetical protein [Bosea sp. 117]|uniref:hypothetical protein n=1 Tax=Bosea sp. 117 TaxID=1125973 RepID=UPI00056FD19B|nr:hypothetical protein [Bosea sp. 117]
MPATTSAVTPAAASAAILKRIRLNLARSKAYPDGSAQHGYEFVAPLDASGHIDLETWKLNRARCVVHRFWANEPIENGYLVRRAGGTTGATWVFDYELEGSDDDEAGYRFGDHAFQPGEYVSIRDEDGEMHTFRVATVEAV